MRSATKKGNGKQVLSMSIVCWLRSWGLVGAQGRLTCKEISASNNLMEKIWALGKRGWGGLGFDFVDC
jgi:hypothetical protein